MNKLVLFLFLLINTSAFAQTEGVEMADTFRSDGKIYVVVAIALLILIGIFIYLISMDRKLARLEKDQK